MKAYRRIVFTLVAAAISTAHGYSLTTAPAPVSLPPCLIEYTSANEYMSSSKLVLHLADQTWKTINSGSSDSIFDLGILPYPPNTVTYPPGSGRFTYTVDAQNASHATIVYDDGVGVPLSTQLYFGTPTAGSLTPPGPNLPGSGSGFTLFAEKATKGVTNVSNRCQLAAGGFAISGFVVQSNGPRWVLVRAIGATLANFGVSTTVSAPSFTIHDSTQAVVGASVVWSADSNLVPGYSSMFSVAGAFPLNSGSDEGVFLGVLNPGAYTAVFAAGSAGTILCEVYILPY